MQRAVLPDRLPDVPGVELAATYMPNGGDEAGLDSAGDAVAVSAPGASVAKTTSYSPRCRDSRGVRRLFNSMASGPSSWRAVAS